MTILDHLPHTDFVAIDFETADTGRDSACAIALVKVEGNRITRRLCQFIRPPRKEFRFTDVHGISWKKVANSPTFAQVWPSVLPMLQGAEFLAAHNAPFDRSVLVACCKACGLQPPDLPFVCTLRLARMSWNLASHNLPTVCGHLGIQLDHHDPASDANACARIVIASRNG